MTDSTIKWICVALAALTSAGCGASMSELREHHVWERAICEASPEERDLVRAGIEEDQQLTLAVQAVPPSAIEALAPDPDPERDPDPDNGPGPGTRAEPGPGAGGAADRNPLADVAIVRVRRRANAVPLESWEVTPRLIADRRSVPQREITFEDLLRRTGETVPPTRRIHHHGGSSSVGPLEFFGRLIAGVMTAGLSELLIRASPSRSSHGYTEEVGPSPSEIAAAAPHASALSVAWADLADGGRVYAWRRPEDDAARAIDLEVTYRGADVHRRPCELTEHVVIELEPGLPIEEAIGRRFGHREHTLAELRAMR